MDETKRQRLQQLIIWIDSQESKLADKDWFKYDRDGTRRKRTEDNVKEMYEEYHQLRKELNLN